MDRHPRHLACAAAVTFLAVGCVDPPPDPPDLAATLRFTDRGVREFFPGHTTAQSTWTTDAPDPVLRIALSLIDTTSAARVTIADGPYAFESATVNWDISQWPPGMYQVQADVLAQGGGEPLATVRSPAIEVIQGVRFLDGDLTLGGGDVPYDLELIIATASVINVEVVATQTPGGGRRLVRRLAVASDLAPIGRSVSWTGRDATGDAIPAGTYRLAAEISAGAGDVLYTEPGPSLTWLP